jgi:hypothetical protein
LEKALDVYLEDFLDLKGSSDARAMPTDGSSGVVLGGTVRCCTRDATSKLPNMDCSIMTSGESKMKI